MEWVQYLKEEATENKLIHHYLAQIAHVIYIGNRGKKGKKLSRDAFLLEFGETKAPKTDAEKKAHISKSKATWMSVAGVSRKNKPLHRF